MVNPFKKINEHRKIVKSCLVGACISVSLNTNKTFFYFYGAIGENDGFDCF